MNAGRPGEKEQERGRVGPAIVKRYRPGVAPDWVKPDDASDAEPEEIQQEEPVLRTAIEAPKILHRPDDPRLARLARQQAGSSDSEGTAAPAGGRRVEAPRVVRRRRREDSDEEQPSDAEVASEQEEEVDLDELERKRAAVRARLQTRVKEEEEQLAQQQAEVKVEEEEEEEASEYETDSEEEETGQQRLKPIFVPKVERETVKDERVQELEAEEEERKARELREQRKAETKALVKERHALEEAMARAAMAEPKHDEGDIDTEDDAEDPDAKLLATKEYNKWEQREMTRIGRYRLDKERETREAAEREMLHSMSEAERRAWELKNPKVQAVQPKEKWRFLQKYWHKGAFFQEAPDNPHAAEAAPDAIYGRDYSAPVGEDKMDKSVLPKVMQVKNFGRRGRTKHTHLVDQDTTVFDDYQPDRTLQDKYQARLGGKELLFSKPKKLPHHKSKEEVKPPPAPNTRAAYLASRY